MISGSVKGIDPQKVKRAWQDFFVKNEIDDPRVSLDLETLADHPRIKFIDRNPLSNKYGIKRLIEILSSRDLVIKNVIREIMECLQSFEPRNIYTDYFIILTLQVIEKYTIFARFETYLDSCDNYTRKLWNDRCLKTIYQALSSFSYSKLFNQVAKSLSAQSNLNALECLCMIAIEYPKSSEIIWCLAGVGLLISLKRGYNFENSDLSEVLMFFLYYIG